MPNMTWDYVAAFIDGEGTITFKRQQLQSRVDLYPFLVIYQKDVRILRKLARFFKASGVNTLVRRAAHETHRLDIGGQRLLPIMRKLARRLFLKRRQAEILIAFIRCRQRRTSYKSPYDAHCLRLDRRMRRLNQRGGSGRHAEIRRPSR